MVHYCMAVWLGCQASSIINLFVPPVRMFEKTRSVQFINRNINVCGAQILELTLSSAISNLPVVHPRILHPNMRCAVRYSTQETGKCTDNWEQLPLVCQNNKFYFCTTVESKDSKNRFFAIFLQDRRWSCCENRSPCTTSPWLSFYGPFPPSSMPDLDMSIWCCNCTYVGNWENKLQFHGQRS